MCLAIPAKVVDINGERADVDAGGAIVSIGLDLVDDVKIGDYVIVHAGYALEKLNRGEAQKRLELFEELAREGHIRA